jgi:hypothetical protein
MRGNHIPYLNPLHLLAIPISHLLYSDTHNFSHYVIDISIKFESQIHGYSILPLQEISKAWIHKQNTILLLNVLKTLASTKNAKLSKNNIQKHK